MSPNAKRDRLKKKGSFIAAVSIAAAGLAMVAGLAGAAVISGSMVYRDGKPADRRQLHFENQVTEDMYVAPTKSDGAFEADLPPGLYDLRAERGAILKGDIQVRAADQNVGQVVEPLMLDPRRAFQHEGIADTILDFAAPATASMTGRAITGMRYGHEAIASMNARSTPVPMQTPLAEPTPAAAPAHN
ncbi:MAG TPA: hypothetical protein VMU16_11980 [Candidatus Binataceae bacterium]|nr:hypothetical protein [Candidatus Binataceae bacterium]